MPGTPRDAWRRMRPENRELICRFGAVDLYLRGVVTLADVQVAATKRRRAGMGWPTW